MKRNLAEFIGTFILVLIGCGAAVIAGMSPAVSAPSGVGLLGISFAFGLSVLVMCYAIGPLTGCHINPAITIAMLVAGKTSGKEATGYIISQIAGGIAASAVLYLIASGQQGFIMKDWALGSNGWGEGYLGEYSTAAAFITEFIMSFIFIFVVFATTDKIGNATMAGLAIGLTLVIVHLVSIPITGTSVNPARSIGPALLSGGIALKQLWMFIVTPILGGIASAFTYKTIFSIEK